MVDENSKQSMRVIPKTDLFGNNILCPTAMVHAEVIAVADESSAVSGHDKMHCAKLKGFSETIFVPEYIKPGDQVYFHRRQQADELQLNYVFSPDRNHFDLAYRSLHAHDNASYDPAAQYLAKLILLLHHCNLSVCDLPPDQDYKLIEYLMHGGRIIIDQQDLDDAQRRDLLALFAPGMQERAAASHSLRYRDGDVQERKHKLKDFWRSLAKRQHWGINLAVGGNQEYFVERKRRGSYSEKSTIEPTANGAHGHIYINCQQKDCTRLPGANNRRDFGLLLSKAYIAARKTITYCSRMFQRHILRRHVSMPVNNNIYPQAIAIGIEPSDSGKKNALSQEAHSKTGSSGRVSPFGCEKINQHQPGDRAAFVAPGQKYNNFKAKLSKQALQQLLADCADHSSLHQRARKVMFKAPKNAQKIHDSEQATRLAMLQDYHQSATNRPPSAVVPTTVHVMDEWVEGHTPLGDTIIHTSPPTVAAHADSFNEGYV